jgi:hypothetical protein
MIERHARRGRPPSENVLVRWDPAGGLTGRWLPMHHFRKTLDDGYFDEGTKVVVRGRGARVFGCQLKPQVILFEERTTHGEKQQARGA